MKDRDVGIDFLKCVAAILITNSHMELLHPSEALATGGAIGNVLFFFCSGFTLFLKPMGRFDNFYKKRIARIYPAIFSWTALTILLFNWEPTVSDMLLYGGGWFVGCIMTHYVVVYFVGKYMAKRMFFAVGLSLVLVLFWYLLLDRPQHYNMYGDFSFFRYAYYFPFMLLGAMLGRSQTQKEYSFAKSLLKLCASILLYYAILYFSSTNALMEQLQLVSLGVLLLIPHYFYQWASSNRMKNIYTSKYFWVFVQIVGGLTLEIYIVQHPLFTDKMNAIYPLNLIVMFVIVVLVAYLLRSTARLFSQVFSEGDMEWKKVFRVY